VSTQIEQVDPWKAKVIRHHRAFRWVRWKSSHPEWTHDHCFLCAACICNHGGERHYAQAYVSELPGEPPFWLCRSCFKVVHQQLGLQRLSRDGSVLR
jgi:hypothetical protein